MTNGSSKTFDAIIRGNLVADVIGRPINLKKAIRSGTLTFVDGIQLFTGGLGGARVCDILDRSEALSPARCSRLAPTV